MPTYAELADKLPEQDREEVRELAENVLFMRRKLAETRKGLEEAPVVIPYDNGGGQVGIRANPAYAEYEKLLKSYTQALSELRGMVEKAQGVESKQIKVTTMVGNSKWAKGRAVNE